jgi:hypothetical protein
LFLVLLAIHFFVWFRFSHSYGNVTHHEMSLSFFFFAGKRNIVGVI